MSVDVNGYCPTHNSKFSKPQGPDASGNVANCRTGGCFKDRAGLGAGRTSSLSSPRPMSATWVAGLSPRWSMFRRRFSSRAVTGAGFASPIC